MKINETEIDIQTIDDLRYYLHIYAYFQAMLEYISKYPYIKVVTWNIANMGMNGVDISNMEITWNDNLPEDLDAEEIVETLMQEIPNLIEEKGNIQPDDEIDDIIYGFAGVQDLKSEMQFRLSMIKKAAEKSSMVLQDILKETADVTA